MAEAFQYPGGAARLVARLVGARRQDRGAVKLSHPRRTRIRISYLVRLDSYWKCADGTPLLLPQEEFRRSPFRKGCRVARNACTAGHREVCCSRGRLAPAPRSGSYSAPHSESPCGGAGAATSSVALRPCAAQVLRARRHRRERPPRQGRPAARAGGGDAHRRRLRPRARHQRRRCGNRGASAKAAPLVAELERWMRSERERLSRHCRRRQGDELHAQPLAELHPVPAGRCG